MVHIYSRKPLAVVLALVMAIAVFAMTSGVRPHEISADPGYIVANTTIQFTIHLESASQEDQSVVIGSTTKSTFSSLPTSVVVPAGQSSASFQATASGNPVATTVSATCNGGTALISLPVQAQP